MGKGDKKKRKKKKKKEIYSLPEKRNEKTINIRDLSSEKIGNENKGGIFNESTYQKEEYRDKEHMFEVIIEDLNYNEKEPVHFLKWGFKYNTLNDIKIKDIRDFKETFPFAKENDNENKKFKNLKNTEFAFAWFKDKVKGRKAYKSSSSYDVENLSGILKNEKARYYLSELPPYSFILQAKIKFVAPYFSKDDEFYLIQNPCLKEKVFKVPMVRGSGWKGALASAFKDLINREINKMDVIQSYLRIFGTGSDDFRRLSDMLNDYLKNGKKLSFESIVSFVLFELGLKLTEDDIKKLKSEENLEEWVKKKIWKELEKESNKNLPTFFKTHRGRAIFYPTYFDKLSLEIINPHDRRKRAGTNPIHYEVVPKDEKGVLQIIYIPFDAVLRSNEKIEQEVKNDIKYLCLVLENLQNIGIGAKGKLGWGRFKLEDKKVLCNVSNIEIPKEWNNG